MENFDEDVWQMVTEFGEYERHFNKLQHNYRALASTWLLAMFAGIGYVLTAKDLPFIPQPIIAFLGLAGACGMTLLWNLDLRVYHQLLESCFVEGLKLEKKYSWLPQTWLNMMETQDGKPKGVLARVVWFYVIGNTVALLVSGAAAALWAKQTSEIIAIIGITALVVVFLGYFIFKNTRSPLLEAWVRANKAN
jgi:fucose 4-O-acetylase-like acetyltransferase